MALSQMELSQLGDILGEEEKFGPRAPPSCQGLPAEPHASQTYTLPQAHTSRYQLQPGDSASYKIAPAEGKLLSPTNQENDPLCYGTKWQITLLDCEIVPLPRKRKEKKR